MVKKSPQNISSLLNKFNQQNNNGSKLIILLSVVGLLLFLVFSSFLPFKDKLFSTLYPKKSSYATYSFTNVVTDSTTVFSVSSAPKPAYLSPVTLQPFNLPVTRIGGDAGTSFTALNGTGRWGTDVRQHYNDDQAWNADGSLIALQNGGTGASSSSVYIDGETYQPKYIKCSNYDVYDDKWNPNILYKNVRIGVKGSTLQWFDVSTCSQIRSWSLPFSAQNDMSQNPSVNGRYIALWDNTRVFVVDMDPQSPLASYESGNKRIGPAFNLSTNCGRPNCTVDHLAISPTGKYIVAEYEGDYPRVFDVNPDTLAITPHAQLSTASLCADQSSKQLPNPADGWIWDVGHEGMAINSYDNNEEVIIGQFRSWCSKTLNGVSLGSVIMVRLKDGKVTSLTNPSNEAYSYHISTVNNERPGWAYVSYWPGSGKRFNDEIIAVKMDGSKDVQRFVHTRTSASNCYRCEAHPVPSRDGTRIIFASSWSLNCGSSCGSESNPQAYIVDARALGTSTSTLTPTVTSQPTPTSTPVLTPTPTSTPRPTSIPTITSSGGIKAEYFDNKDFTGLKITRMDRIIDFIWGRESADASVKSDTFSVRWTGLIVPPTSGQYTFYIASDDGSRLWINNQKIVDLWGDHRFREKSGVISLDGGRAYPVKLDYYENYGDATVKLYWSSSTISKQIIPTSVFK